MGAVGQHIGAGVGRGPGADHLTRKSVPGQYGYPTGMINMGMGKDHIGDDPRIKGHDPVFPIAFFAPALKHAAIQKDPVPVHG